MYILTAVVLRRGIKWLEPTKGKGALSILSALTVLLLLVRLQRHYYLHPAAFIQESLYNIIFILFFFVSRVDPLLLILPFL